jgi:hypothetical protein
MLKFLFQHQRPMKFYSNWKLLALTLLIGRFKRVFFDLYFCLESFHTYLVCMTWLIHLLFYSISVWINWLINKLFRFINDHNNHWQWTWRRYLKKWHKIDPKNCTQYFWISFHENRTYQIKFQISFSKSNQTELWTPLFLSYFQFIKTTLQSNLAKQLITYMKIIYLFYYRYEFLYCHKHFIDVFVWYERNSLWYVCEMFLGYANNL